MQLLWMPQRSKSTIKYYQVKLKKRKEKKDRIEESLTKTNLVHLAGARKLDRRTGGARTRGRRRVEAQGRRRVGVKRRRVRDWGRQRVGDRGMRRVGARKVNRRQNALKSTMIDDGFLLPSRMGSYQRRFSLTVVNGLLSATVFSYRREWALIGDGFLLLALVGIFWEWRQ